MLYLIVKLQSSFQRLRENRKAVTSIEYALIAALIAVVIISALTSLGKGVAATFNKVASEL